MKNPEPLLTVKLTGDAVGEGKIGVNHLLRLLDQLNKVFFRVGQVLQGEIECVRRGPKEKSVKDTVSLDLVLLTHGSPAAVLGFERRISQPSLPEMDFGLEIFEKTFTGLAQAQLPAEALPAGFDLGVVMAWRDMGTLFRQGVDKIEFTLNHRDRPITANYDPGGCARLQERIQGPQMNIRTIEGRLLMADFKEHGTRCRVHPAVGEPVLCLFADEKKDEVLENILHFVKVIGEAKEDPLTGRISSILIHDIQRLEDKEGEAVDLLPQGLPLPIDFWQSPSIEELARSQGVGPIQDIRSLFGTWPGEEGDGFEEEITALRESNLAVKA